jgi:uncharacterized membrane protein YdbT with pleckstrin-like domain
MATKRDRAQKRQFTGQEEGEQVVQVAHQFPVVMRRQLIIFLIFVLVGLVPWAVAYGNNYDWQNYATLWLVGWLIVAIFYAIRSWVGWYYTIYLLTNRRIVAVKQVGFFNRSVNDLALANIQNVNYTQKGLQAMLFGYGTIAIETLSGAGGLKLTFIHRPQQLQQAIMRRVHDGHLDKKATDSV